MTSMEETSGVISHLLYYPVKSLRGIPLDNAVLTPRGIAADRMWMLVHEGGTFITQREEHRLALLKVTERSDGFRIAAPSGEEITLPKQISAGALSKRVRVWKDELPAVRGPRDANDFFSDYLGYACEAVFMPEDAKRMARESAPAGTPLSFADAYPGLLITSESLADLSARTPIPLVIDRFRPNIVVSGTEAYAEDRWLSIDVGKASLSCVKPCARCVLTTVDPLTGVSGKEPLRTLATYRRLDNDVVFGQNFVVTKGGEVSLGDSVRVVTRKDAPFS